MNMVYKVFSFCLFLYLMLVWSLSSIKPGIWWVVLKHVGMAAAAVFVLYAGMSYLHDYMLWTGELS